MKFFLILIFTSLSFCSEKSEPSTSYFRFDPGVGCPPGTGYVERQFVDINGNGLLDFCHSDGSCTGTGDTQADCHLNPLTPTKEPRIVLSYKEDSIVVVKPTKFSEVLEISIKAFNIDPYINIRVFLMVNGHFGSKKNRFFEEDYFNIVRNGDTLVFEEVNQKRKKGNSSEYVLPIPLKMQYHDAAGNQNWEIDIGRFVDIDGDGCLDVVYSFGGYAGEKNWTLNAVFLCDIDTKSYKMVSCEATGSCSCENLLGCAWDTV